MPIKIGEKVVGLNRIELSKIIESWEYYKDGIKEVSLEHFYLLNSLGLADAIIAQEHNLIEVVEDKKGKVIIEY